MPLSPGSSFGSFEVIGLLGAGGMGEVYRARDMRLKREVALKVLPEEFASDPGRMARLQREAEVLASLNHPNIAAIYGLEGRALVMELVEGGTLADALAPGSPLSIDEALRIAAHIADALEYAHERGVVHRDLKPANVKVTADGTAKLLDFGLAKAALDPMPSTNLTQSPTMAVGMTQVGIILGTAAYMSPEQARGREADRRSDIWAFGVVLYEMLTGTQMFRGDTVTDVLASVVKEEPDLRGVPARLRRLLRACLQKDPKQRLQSIGDWRLLLDEGESEAATSTRRPSLQWVLIGLLIASIGAAVWGWLRPRPSEPRAQIRFTMSIPDRAAVNGQAAITADGLHLAFATGPMQPIYFRSLAESEAVPIRGTESGGGPSFSPDGQSIAFLVQEFGRSRQLKKALVNGGGAVTLADQLEPGAGFTSWAEDNTILFVTNNGLFRISAASGPPKLVASIDGAKERFFGPQQLPGGTHILTGIVDAGGATLSAPNARVVAIDVQSGKATVLLESAGHARYVPSRDDESSGHIVFGREASLFAAPFDVRSLRVGTRVPVLESVMARGPFYVFNVSRSGTLVYADAGSRSGLATSTLVWKDRRGNEEAIPGPGRPYVNVRLSHDGSKLAVAVQRPPLRLPPLLNLGIVDLVRGTLTPLTTEGTASIPIWSADDRRVWFLNSGLETADVRVVPADGSGAVETVIPPKAGVLLSWLLAGPDGPVALFRRDVGPGGLVLSLSLADASRGGEAKALAVPASGGGRDLSPDGRLIAFDSSETGRNEIWVTPYPGPGPRVLVSTEGGEAPRWNPKGHELFYRNGTKLMAVDIETVPVLRAGTPKVLFDSPDTSPTLDVQRIRGYDISPDGLRFLLIKRDAAAAQSNDVQVIVNWADELSRRAPLK